MDRSREDQVLASATRAAAEQFSTLSSDILVERRAASADGRLNSSNTVLRLAGICIGAFKKAADAAAERIAEIEQSKAIAYSDKLGPALEPFRVRAISAFKELGDGRDGAHLERLHSQQLARVDSEITSILDGLVADLSIGIAGGVNVDREKSRIIAINNSNGNGQFTIDSNHVTQSVGRDMNAGVAVQDLVALISEFQKKLADEALTDEAKADLEDAALNAEREISGPAPDPARVARLTGKLKELSEKIGTSALGGIAARIVTAAIGI